MPSRRQLQGRDLLHLAKVFSDPLVHLLTDGLARFDPSDVGSVLVSGAIIVRDRKAKDRLPYPRIDRFNFNAVPTFTDTRHLREFHEHRQRYTPEVQRRVDRRCHLPSLFGLRDRSDSRTAPYHECCLRIADTRIIHAGKPPIAKNDYVSHERTCYLPRSPRRLVHFDLQHPGQNGFRG